MCTRKRTRFSCWARGLEFGPFPFRWLLLFQIQVLQISELKFKLTRKWFCGPLSGSQSYVWFTSQCASFWFGTHSLSDLDSYAGNNLPVNKMKTPTQKIRRKFCLFLFYLLQKLNPWFCLDLVYSMFQCFAKAETWILKPKKNAETWKCCLDLVYSTAFMLQCFAKAGTLQSSLDLVYSTAFIFQSEWTAFQTTWVSDILSAVEQARVTVEGFHECFAFSCPHTPFASDNKLQSLVPRQHPTPSSLIWTSQP